MVRMKTTWEIAAHSTYNKEISEWQSQSGEKTERLNYTFAILIHICCHHSEYIGKYLLITWLSFLLSHLYILTCSTQYLPTGENFACVLPIPFTACIFMSISYFIKKKRSVEDLENIWLLCIKIKKTNHITHSYTCWRNQLLDRLLIADYLSLLVWYWFLLYTKYKYDFFNTEGKLKGNNLMKAKY